MVIGIALGLAAALFWGTADFSARGAARAGGTFLTLLWVQMVAIVVLLLTALPLGWLPLARLPLGATLAAVGTNLCILVGAGLLYRAMAIGTVALVSPICASFAAITAILALATGERPTAAQLAGIVLTLGGVVLASALPNSSHAPAGTAPAPSGSTWWRPAPGVTEALLAMFFFGTGYWALQYVVAVLGGVPVVFIGKVGDLAALCALSLGALALGHGAGAKAHAWWAPHWPPRRFWPFLLPAAVLDTAGNIAYNLGVTHALTAVVVVLSSLFSAVTVLLAWIVLGERLARWQWVGVIAILAGVALVSL